MTFSASAQNLSSTGSLIVLPATGELTYANDQAQVIFSVEEQDKDKTVAASRVNQKMKAGTEALKRLDPQASLKTVAYATYAVYANETASTAGKPRVVTGWRVSQSLQVTSTNLDGLPKLTAAAQTAQLTLNGVQFGLSPGTIKRLDAGLIDAVYQKLNERIAALANAMRRSPADASLETLDFEGSGNFSNNESAMPKAMMMRSAAPMQDAVAEPSFERGETTLNLHAVAKIRFK
ncbi:SIMPL domain-containing protein [Herbaspirillum sp. RTI4]|uniref:SIMPL domain-containing protein n=1 Tax=Herbaspirillum sp. RTI4 TaxID=3048640 RepID=UPI002AB47384|nr:SIMPL domain-containing protein [Herbaspirillum sp. RTI4]MDY7578457.1 SIMPL domain-containing protein [Herbaspirillum sp. RTI4]MEA9981514.1 SIMPL domain-containing protein [Herbaspirillum sp. RTI4]